MTLQEDFLTMDAPTLAPASAANKPAPARRPPGPETRSPNSTVENKRRHGRNKGHGKRTTFERELLVQKLSPPEKATSSTYEANAPHKSRMIKDSGTQDVPLLNMSPTCSPCPSAPSPSKPDDDAASSQAQASDSSSDWSITTERAREAMERANLPALDLMQRAMEQKVAALETKLIRTKALLQNILTRQQNIKAKLTRVVKLEAVD